jgi:hypothetical protein
MERKRAVSTVPYRDLAPTDLLTPQATGLRNQSASAAVLGWVETCETHHLPHGQWRSPKCYQIGGGGPSARPSRDGYRCAPFILQNYPTGKSSDKPPGFSRVSSPRRKNIPFHAHPKSNHNARILSHRGAFRDRHGRWGGMRWTLVAPLTNGAIADGEVVWS